MAGSSANLQNDPTEADARSLHGRRAVWLVDGRPIFIDELGISPDPPW